MNGHNLVGKQVGVFGLKNSGKTNFVKWLLKNFYPRSFVFDPMDEYKDEWGFNQYVPQQKRSQAELEMFIDQVIKPNKQQIDMMVVDESNRYHTKGGELDGPVAEIIDYGTSHWNLGAIFIARRPVQVHTDILELSEYLFIFRLTGKNDHKRLDNIAPGLSDAVRDLPQYGCVMVKPDRSFEVLQPVPLMDNDKPTS